MSLTSSVWEGPQDLTSLGHRGLLQEKLAMRYGFAIVGECSEAYDKFT
jgi:hypothetical protein